MNNEKKTSETPKKKRPYRRPEVLTEEVTERQGLETCQPVPDAEQGCTPNA